MDPRTRAQRLERRLELPPGTEERFAGYGITGVPFSSGHVLCLRRFPASSLGRGYTSIWHRRPDGSWIFYQDVEAELSCPRYFGRDIEEVRVRPIELSWTGSHGLTVLIEEEALLWHVELVSTPATRALTALAGVLSDSVWRNRAAMQAMSRMAGALLGAGRLALAGRTSNGQAFVANPFQVWMVGASRATLGGVDLGRPAPLAAQERLGDFWISQRGIFLVGRVFLEAFDASRHVSRVSRAA